MVRCDTQAQPKSVSHPGLTPRVVIDSLSPFVSAERKRRIDTVVKQRLLGVTVVLENLYDPHNGAAALRSCEAMGVLQVHVISPSGCFPFSRKVTQGADKWLNIYVHRSSKDCLSLLHDWGYECLATKPPDLGETAGGPAVQPTRPVALVFGNEHMGISDDALALCDRRIHLPMYGFTESLNLSVSVAVLVKQVTDAARRRLGALSDLPESAATQLRAAYLALSTEHAPDLLCERLRRTIATDSK